MPQPQIKVIDRGKEIVVTYPNNPNMREKVITKFEHLPLDAPMLQCETCTYIAQPIEMEGRVSDLCPHCGKPFKETTRKGVHLFRWQSRKVPLPPVVIETLSTKEKKGYQAALKKMGISIQ